MPGVVSSYSGDLRYGFSEYDADREVLYISWVAGGKTGGNCWTGQSHMEALSADEEPDFDALDKYLEENFPQITYLQYKKIEKLIKTFDHTVQEYYGNYTIYRKKFIFVDELRNLIDELL